MCPQKFLQIYSRAGALNHTMILRVEGQDITLQGRSIGSMQSFDREAPVRMPFGLFSHDSMV